MHLFCTEKNASLFKPAVKGGVKKKPINVTLIIRVNEVWASEMDAVLQAIKLDKPIGTLAINPSGTLSQTLADRLVNFEVRDVTKAFSNLLMVKDEDQIQSIWASGYLSASVMREFCVPKLGWIIQNKREVTHSGLVSCTKRMFSKLAELKKEPMFQSGSHFDLTSNASNDDNLYCGPNSVIICAIASRYNSYFSYVARTFLIDANAVQSKAYKILLGAHEAAMAKLKHGNKVSDVYRAALAVVRMYAEDWTRNLTETAGTGIGLELRESELNLDGDNNQLLMDGMVFNVSLGFNDLSAETVNSGVQKFSLLLADTVIVTKDGCDVATQSISKEVENVELVSLRGEVQPHLESSEEEDLQPHLLGGLKEEIENRKKNVLSVEVKKEELITARKGKQKELNISGVYIRPIDEVDRWTGTLHAHRNGFRFRYLHYSGSVDIMYGNIKHAFFQPAEKEMIRTLIHFNLHECVSLPVETKDIQFCAMTNDLVELQKLLRGQRSAYDPNKFKEEQRLIAYRNNIYKKFKYFVEKVNDLWNQKGLNLVFEQPLRELGFQGVPHGTSGFIVPTPRCLVELIDPTYLVITLSEIVIVSLERVGLGQKNFDMVIVLVKNFRPDIIRIDSIPSASLDWVKDWLERQKIKYQESKCNLKWGELLKVEASDSTSSNADGEKEIIKQGEI